MLKALSQRRENNFCLKKKKKTKLKEERFGIKQRNKFEVIGTTL